MPPRSRNVLREVGMEINVDGVCFSYGRKRVLHGIDWVVRPGVTGLFGPNGSGKTTLLSVLIGLLRPNAGSVVAHVAGIERGDGTPATGSDGRRDARAGRHTSARHTSVGQAAAGRGEARFGFVPQRFSMAGGMRVVDAVSYTAWVNGVSRGECEPAALRALAAVDLTDKARAKVKTLSGGQRQRAGIAAGLAHEPDVLVLDEPTVGLDAEQRWRVRDMIAEIGRTRTVVVSTHLLDEDSRMCDRVAVLADGELVFDGTVAELEANHDTGDDVRTDARRSRIEQGYQRLLQTAGGNK